MIVFVSGPYRAPTYREVGENILAARNIAIDLWNRGFYVFCPHLNTAHFEVDCKAEDEQYLRGDLELLSWCGAIIMVPGWEKSIGAIKEKEYAEKLSIPVYIWPKAPRLLK